MFVVNWLQWWCRYSEEIAPVDCFVWNLNLAVTVTKKVLVLDRRTEIYALAFSKYAHSLFINVCTRYAIKRRFLYTSEDTFRSVVVEFINQHYTQFLSKSIVVLSLGSLAYR